MKQNLFPEHWRPVMTVHWTRYLDPYNTSLRMRLVVDWHLSGKFKRALFPRSCICRKREGEGEEALQVFLRLLHVS